MKRPKTNLQNGIALVSALLILILLSAIAVGLVLTSNTETAVNANYRQERALDFAARAGVEEVRDRMAPASAHTLISPTCTPASACVPATAAVPSTSNNGILYVRGGVTRLPSLRGPRTRSIQMTNYVTTDMDWLRCKAPMCTAVPFPRVRRGMPARPATPPGLVRPPRCRFTGYESPGNSMDPYKIIR